MGDHEKESRCSPVPIPESPGSALQKLKKGLSTCYNHHLLRVLCNRDWERVDLPGDNSLFVARHKDDGIFRWRSGRINVDREGDRHYRELVCRSLDDVTS